MELETFDLNEHEALASLEAFLTERGGLYEAQGTNAMTNASTRRSGHFAAALGVAFALGTLPAAAAGEGRRVRACAGVPTP